MSPLYLVICWSVVSTWSTIFLDPKLIYWAKDLHLGQDLNLGLQLYALVLYHFSYFMTFNNYRSIVNDKEIGKKVNMWLSCFSVENGSGEVGTTFPSLLLRREFDQFSLMDALSSHLNYVNNKTLCSSPPYFMQHVDPLLISVEKEITLF